MINCQFHYRVGDKNKSERASLYKKLAQLLSAINRSTVTEEDREYYINKFSENPERRNQELEYVMILTDRYLGYDKPDMLAKLYLAYLREKICWQEFAMYAEVIDRFLPGDCSLLCSEAKIYSTIKNVGIESILRLIALGLLCEVGIPGPFEENRHGGFSLTATSFAKAHNQEKNYKRTEFGEQLAGILREPV